VLLVAALCPVHILVHLSVVETDDDDAYTDEPHDSHMQDHDDSWDAAVAAADGDEDDASHVTKHYEAVSRGVESYRYALPQQYHLQRMLVEESYAPTP